MKITIVLPLASVAVQQVLAAVLPEDTFLQRRAFTVGQGVQTSSGLAQGQPASSRPQVSEYLGIPFAKPPVGNLRFAAPQTFVGSGSIKATAFVCLTLICLIPLFSRIYH